MTDLHSEILREVLSVRDFREMLLRLNQATSPIQYSQFRRELGIHPEKFKRGLERLDHFAMIGRRLRGEPNNLGHREVFLEATAIGHFWAERWLAWQRETLEQAAAKHIPLQE